MIDAIASIASSLSSATVLTKALLGMKVDQEVIAKVSALQSEIMTAQSAALDSLAERAKLMAEVDRIKQMLVEQGGWSADSARYILTTYPTGAHVYKLRDADPLGETAHRICPACFQHRKKSILQVTQAIRGGEVVTCPDCKTVIELMKSASRQAVPVVPQHSAWSRD